MRKRAMLVLVLVCIAVLFIGSSAIAAPDHLTYEEFITLLQQDKIKSVEFYGLSAITGIYLDGTHEQEFSTYSRVGSVNDPLLTALLVEKAVPVSMKGDVTLSPIFPAVTAGLLMFILPIVLILFLVLRMNAKLNRLIKREAEPH